MATRSKLWTSVVLVDTISKCHFERYKDSEARHTVKNNRNKLIHSGSSKP